MKTNFLTQVSLLSVWTSDTIAFSLFQTVRLSAYDLIQSLCEEVALSSHCHAAIVAAMEKHFQEATQANSPHWWKVG